jgi:DNA adenine methylase
MSPGHPRFTESAIERLRSFQVTNFEVGCADFRESIPKHSDAFLYLDPPYMNGHALYGINGDTHKDFNHQELADMLYKRERWIMSYNDCSTIRELYADNPILSLEWVYGMSKNKQSSEVLILSKDLAI